MTPLPTRVLGRTGLEVTVLGFGTKDLRPPTSHGGFGAISNPDQAGRILNAVLDAGINYIDTAIDYGPSEGFIGQYVGHRRSEYLLASKCGCLVSDRPVLTETDAAAHDFRRENVVAGVEQSLRRLRTDYLDLVQVHHAPEPSILARDDLVATLQELQGRGLVRFIGISAVLPEVADLVALGAFDVVQVPYSALERAHEPVIRAAATTGIGIAVRGALAQGEPGIGRGSAHKWEAFDGAQLADLIGDDSPTQFLLRFALSNPSIDVALVGMSNEQQLTDNIAAVHRGALPDSTYTETRRRLDQRGTASS